jgi:Ca2+/Na+ antiporter
MNTLGSKLLDMVFFVGGPLLIALGFIGPRFHSYNAWPLAVGTGGGSYTYYSTESKVLVITGIIMLGVGVLTKYWTRQKPATLEKPEE